MVVLLLTTTSRRVREHAAAVLEGLMKSEDVELAEDFRSRAYMEAKVIQKRRKQSKVPNIFVHPPDALDKKSGDKCSEFSILVIDLKDLDKDWKSHQEIVDKVRCASKTFGIFQVANHGIPVNVLQEMLKGVHRFFEQGTEAKKQFYTCDVTRKVVYNSNFDLFSSPAANWRDSFFCFMAPFPLQPEELPAPCRDIQMEYSKQVIKLGLTLFGLLSEALGLDTSHLEDMECAKGLAVICHCYPPCPQPELTLGATKTLMMVFSLCFFKIRLVDSKFFIKIF